MAINNLMTPRVSNRRADFQKWIEAWPILYWEVGATSYTPREFQIAKSVAEQGWPKEDALQIIEQFRQEQASKMEKPKTKTDVLRSVAVNEKPEEWINVSWWLTKGVVWAVKGFTKWVEATRQAWQEALWWAISTLPWVAWNVTGWIADIGWDVVQKIWNLFWADITDEQAKALGDILRESWQRQKEWTAETIWVDLESGAAKTGWFITEVGTTLAWPWAISKAWWIGTKLARGAELWVKGELVSEWEATAEGAIVGAATEWALWVAGKWVSKIMPKTKEALEDSLSKWLRGVLKFSSKWAKSSKKVINEEAKAVSWAKTLQQLNPTFKIDKVDDAIPEVNNQIINTKASLFNKMSWLRKWVDWEIETSKVLKEVDWLIKDPDFKALLWVGKGQWEYDRLVNLLRTKWQTISIDDFYAELKKLNEAFWKELTSSDAVNNKIKAKFSQIYTKVLDDKMGKLGWEYKELAKQYSDIRAFEDAMANQLKKILLKKEGNAISDLGDAYLDSSIIFNIFSSPATSAQSLLTKVLKGQFSELRNPNKIVKDFFDNARLYYNLDQPIISETTERVGRDIIKGSTVLWIEENVK